MNKSFLISVVLPVYNVEKYISRALDSLVSQTDGNFEAVIVDDCGDDNSIKIAEYYAQVDNRFKIVYNEKNLGTYHSRRIGVENSIGDYVVFLDPDDEFDKNTIRSLYSANDLKCDVVFFDIDHEPLKKWYQYKIPALPFGNNKRLISNIFKKNFLGYVYISAAAAGKLYNKRYLLECFRCLNIPYDFRYIYSEDRLVFYAALLNNPAYAISSYKGYIYHKNKTSITNSNQLAAPDFLIEQLQFTTQKLKELVVNAELNDEERKFFNYFLNESVQSQVSMMRRFESGGGYYLYHVWTAFKNIPSAKHLIRIVVYLLSFKKIKV